MSRSRRTEILEIIENNSIETQEDLIVELKKRGYNVTQSTVSRDIKQLGLIKVLDSNNRYKYSAGIKEGSMASDIDNKRLIDTFNASFISVKYAMNNVVIKCYAGMAQSGCVAFDILFKDLVIGSLAGDDTIIAVTSDEKSAEMLTKEIINITE